MIVALWMVVDGSGAPKKWNQLQSFRLKSSLAVSMGILPCLGVRKHLSFMESRKFVGDSPLLILFNRILPLV